MRLRFYKCNICGQIVVKLKDTKMPIYCCNEEMGEIIPKENEEGLNEKHIPTYTRIDNEVIVNVGKVFHPSIYEHYIEWVLLVTNKGNQRKTLSPGELPQVTFLVDDDEVVEEVYAYCNIHSLWKLKVRPSKHKC